MGLTPEEVTNAVTISDLKLSQDGSYVVYCVKPHYKSDDRSTSALWLADTAIENSAKQITSGESNDRSPCFHPTSSEIYFLSDRHKVGGSSHIYKLPLGASLKTDPQLVATLDETQSVSAFLISPDGRYLACTIRTQSPDSKGKEGITIWRERKQFSTLHVIDLQDPEKALRTLVSTEAHVESFFTWSPNSTAIMYRLRTHTNSERHIEPAVEAVAHLDEPGVIHNVFEHPKMPDGFTIWRSRGDLVFLQKRSPSYLFSARSLWTRSLSDPAGTHLAYGDTEDALDFIDLGPSGQCAIFVGAGLESRFDIYDADGERFTALETSGDSYQDWGVRLREDGEYVFAALRSSGVRGEPLEIWVGVTRHGEKGTLTTKLTAHHTWLDQGRAPVSRAFRWKSTDGESVEGIISYPRGVEPRNMPTVIVPHGGPSARDLLDLRFDDWGWRQYLASHGYLVLSPNYRGSIGRGDLFARPANGAVGTLDWDDTQTMIDAVIAQGLADPDRVGIAGYSQGGFLTAWGCTRPNSIFKVAIVGAGVSDWGLLSATSDLPDVEAALGGSAPWTPGEPVYLRGSPIKDCKNVRVPLLILHGKEDKRVPLSQAIALFRGVEREAKEAPPPQLVIYPREDHIFQERAHAEDVLKRLLEHLDTYLK
ncbi:alpha/beta-hydrolase [Wolfiporia cocos MD-104 SS10]|uniref:Dipeptidyl-peptidase V n=1 Tax=Wolfiporia cocos (strain MD-104) TaxID=742152 RepID=A0A2H3JQ38_WOLCO|nr:alpha/beta-hydrolase [Wolfiporia cocos MD-104 SS10]